ncbi:MAG TPA: SDR family NAD(P)-dependent oxidoreductase [Gemmatimonadales bacterium]|nr:SDR family NAD(P)-dependent oxidoreductase [Gemmatimonadales bacterium]
MMDFSNGLAVVTGATDGIGRAIAFALGKAGARIAICARTGANVTRTAAELKGEGIDAIGTACDVADPASVRTFADYVRRERGDPTILVNNAGVGVFAPLAQLPLEDWDRVMGTNVRSLYLVTRAFLDGITKAGGVIVNIGSLAGRNGLEGGTAYCASKHALLGFSKSLMLEVRKSGTRVIAICPGSVSTNFSDRQGKRANVERILTPDDVAQAVLGAVTLPQRAMISELDLRPTNP